MRKKYVRGVVGRGGGRLLLLLLLIGHLLASAEKSFVLLLATFKASGLDFPMRRNATMPCKEPMLQRPCPGSYRGLN